MTSIVQDIRYALRMLTKSPGITIIAIVTLALTIGVNTGMFSLMNAQRRIVLRFEDPESLVAISLEHDSGYRGGIREREYFAYLDQADQLADIGLYEMGRVYFDDANLTEHVSSLAVTPNLLPLLGMDTLIGRLPVADEGWSDAAPVVLLTDRFWHRRFDGDPESLGRTVRLDDKPHTVIGIMPPAFDLEHLWHQIDVVVVLTVDPLVEVQVDRTHHALARLEPGASVATAQAEITGITAQLAEAEPEDYARSTVQVETLHDRFFPPDERWLYVGLGLAVALVLLIACCNLANLMLAKATTRMRDYALRVALGASRWRIVRHVLVESALLTLIGGGLGLLFGLWTTRLFLIHNEFIPMLPEEVGLNLAVLGYTIILCGAAALTFGLAPALVASRVAINETLKEGSATTSGGLARNRLRSGLVIAQLAIAIPFLICCGLLLRHVDGLRSIDFGYQTEHVISVAVDLPYYRYPEDAQKIAFYHEALRRIEALPGVESAASASDLPVYGSSGGYARIELEDGRGVDASERIFWNWNSTTPGFFTTLEAPLITGRWFTAHDRVDTPPVALVNKRLADQYWPGEDPIGKRIARRLWNAEGEPHRVTVVGVVGNTGRGFYGEPPNPTVYVPYTQAPEGRQTVVARTHGDPTDAIPTLRGVLLELDPNVALGGFDTPPQIAHRICRDDRMSASFFGGLAVLALCLSVMGLYGVMSYAVAQRTHEIGIRVALGADRRVIMRWVLMRCLRLTAIGLVIGVVLAVPLGLAIQTELFEVSGVDPVTFVAVGCVLFAAGLLAGYVPARRATKVDPMIALRCE